jgi:hypothetical protein
MATTYDPLISPVVTTNSAPTTQATVQGGMSAADYAASLGAPSTFSGKDVNYGYVSPDPTWNQNGNYSGLGLTSDVYGATKGTSGNSSFTPANIGSYAGNIAGANFGITSGITQNNSTLNSVLGDGKGGEVAEWGPGQKVGVDAPLRLDAGYAWQNGQIVRVPTDGSGGVGSSGVHVPGFGADMSGGLIGSANGATQLGSPTQWKVDPSQTVEARIRSIIDPNNPLVQQQRAQALADANSRGMLNTSMAETGADNAVYTAATPIAAADAATYAKAAGYNADEANQFSVQNMQASNTAGNLGRQLTSSEKIAAANNETALKQSQISSQTQLGTAQISANTSHDVASINADSQQKIATLNATSQADIAKLHDENQTLLSTNSAAAQAFNQAVVSMANINQSQTLDAASKTQAIAQIRETLRQQLSTLGSVAHLDLTSSLNFANTPGFDSKGNWIGFPDSTTTTTNNGGGGGGAGLAGTV